MSLEFRSTNGSRAMRLARQIVKPLDWGDMEAVVTGSMPCSEYQQLFMAVSDDFLENEQRIDEIKEAIDALQNEEAKRLFDEYDDVRITNECTKLLAWFQLGYATALRLLGTPPPMEVVNGGIKEARLKGKCSL